MKGQGSKTGKHWRNSVEVKMASVSLTAEFCYLLRQSQKSSSASTAIITSPLLQRLTGHVTGVTKEIVLA